MKVIAIGDTHGRMKWKDIVLKEADADKIIFIGDYFDARDGGYSGNRQIENFKDILEFKKANPDKVVMLTGNHDFHYIKRVYAEYSGYQRKYASSISYLVETAIEDGHLQMAYLHDNYLFTHAGLTKTWCGLIMGNYNPTVDDVLIEHLNTYLKVQPQVFDFKYGANMDNTGDDITQGPIWVRPRSLLMDMVDGVTCVVGHTPVKYISLNPAFPKLIMIDCLGDTNEYLIINDGKPSVGV